MKKHKHSSTEKKDGMTVRIIKKTYQKSKETAIKHGTTSIIALIMGSVMPMLEQWHADSQHKDEINGITSQASGDTKECEARLNQLIRDLDARSNNHIISVEDAENQKIKAIWEYIGNQNRNGKK